MKPTQKDLNQWYEHKSNKERYIETEEKALEEKEAEQDDILEGSTSLEEFDSVAKIGNGYKIIIEKKIDNEKIEDLEEGDRTASDYDRPLTEEESEGDLKQF